MDRGDVHLQISIQLYNRGRSLNLENVVFWYYLFINKKIGDC
jgi:hypothetical protein